MWQNMPFAQPATGSEARGPPSPQQVAHLGRQLSTQHTDNTTFASAEIERE